MTPLGMDAEGRDPGFARLQPILEEGDLAGEREQEAASAALCFDDVAALRDELGFEKHLRSPGPYTDRIRRERRYPDLDDPFIIPGARRSCDCVCYRNRLQCSASVLI